MGEIEANNILPSCLALLYAILGDREPPLRSRPIHRAQQVVA